ncbi:MAG: hypothetical protein ACLPTZ_20985 [Beijerinckiaceae bacterium]|jgi:hypothetical protein
MKALAVLLLALVSATPTLAGQTLDDIRAGLTLRFVRDCMQGGRPPLTGTVCTCWGRKLIEPMTTSEADAILGGAMPQSFHERDITAAEACVFEYLAR